MSCYPTEQGYDPFKPEVVRHENQQNGKTAPSGDISGALELVNKAIEEVQSEVERERRKLSRIGDEVYDPSKSVSLSSSVADKSQTAPSHLAYDPGSYQMTSGDYNPTPSCSKYTLDSDSQGNKSNSMEYVPTSLKKAPTHTRTHTPQAPSPPPSPKYSSSTSSSKCKYTVDNSRPSTDMEYDPLSNYSAGIAVKCKGDGSANIVKTEGSKTDKLPVFSVSDEEYVVPVKKSRQQTVDTKKYTFSESDEESSGTEYRPTSLSNLQQRKATTGSVKDNFGKKSERTESILNALANRNNEDLALDSVQDDSGRKNNLEKKKVTSQTTNEKSGKLVKMQRTEKLISKTSGSKSSSSGKDKGSINKISQDSSKKENKSYRKRDDGKSIVKVKTPDKVNREEKRRDGKINPVEKVKPNSSCRDKITDSSSKKRKKSSTSDKEREHRKYEEHQHKNGKLDCSKKEKDITKLSKSTSSSGSSNSKLSSVNSKEVTKLKVNSSKNKQQRLSHADLFGDESPDEAEPIIVDDDDDEDEDEEVLVRKSVDALKRARLNKRKSSEITPSSSDDEGDHNLVSSREGKNEVDHVGFDFSSFQDDLDFDSDPMEECLRIFNESKDVKREDKGRQTKQVLMPYCIFFC